jgi:hypothetical protein
MVRDDLVGASGLPHPRSSLAVSVGAERAALRAMPAARAGRPPWGMGGRSTSKGPVGRNPTLSVKGAAQLPEPISAVFQRSVASFGGTSRRCHRHAAGAQGWRAPGAWPSQQAPLALAPDRVGALPSSRNQGGEGARHGCPGRPHTNGVGPAAGQQNRQTWRRATGRPRPLAALGRSNAERRRYPVDGRTTDGTTCGVRGICSRSLRCRVQVNRAERPVFGFPTQRFHSKG